MADAKNAGKKESEIKDNLTSTNFSDILKKIEQNSQEVNKATDTLRDTLNLFCNNVSKNFDNEESANIYKRELELRGFKKIKINKYDPYAPTEITVAGNIGVNPLLQLRKSRYIVTADGILLDNFRKSGIEFVSELNLTPKETIPYHFAFGKLAGIWQFYLIKGIIPSNQIIQLDQLSRDKIPIIIENLPAILEEYLNYITDKKNKLTSAVEKANDLKQKVIRDLQDKSR